MARHSKDDHDTTIQDLLNLPEDERHVLNWMQRRTTCSFSALVAFLQVSEEAVSQLLDTLQRKGFVTAIANSGSDPHYQVRLGSMRHQRQRTNESSLFDRLIDDD